MKQLTAKQRKEFYLKAAEYYNSYQGKGWWDEFYYEGFCGYCQYNKCKITDFPEYELFKNGLYYFPRYTEDYKIDNSERILALFLSYNMVK